MKVSRTVPNGTGRRLSSYTLERAAHARADRGHRRVPAELVRLVEGLALSRPWLAIVLDGCSRAVAGYSVFLGAPSSLNLSLALRQAIWCKTDPGWAAHGIPDVLYADHGCDFTSDHLAQVAADLHIELVHSISGRTARPGSHPNGRGSLTAGCPAPPDTLEDLDLLLVIVATPRVVHRDGIRFQGLRYLDPTLAAYVGEPVTIRYDPAPSEPAAPETARPTRTRLHTYLEDKA